MLVAAALLAGLLFVQIAAGGDAPKTGSGSGRPNGGDDDDQDLDDSDRPFDQKTFLLSLVTIVVSEIGDKVS